MSTPALENVPLAEYHDRGVITSLELQALQLRFPDWPASQRKLSSRLLTHALGVSRTTVRDRITNGLRKIAAYEEAKAA